MIIELAHNNSFPSGYQIKFLVYMGDSMWDNAVLKYRQGYFVNEDDLCEIHSYAGPIILPCVLYFSNERAVLERGNNDSI